MSCYYSLHAFSPWIRISQNYRGNITVALFWCLGSLKEPCCLTYSFSRCHHSQHQPKSLGASRTVQVMSMATLNIKGFSPHIYRMTVQTLLNSLCSVIEEVDSLCIIGGFAALDIMPLSESPSCNHFQKLHISFINNWLNFISCIHKQSLKSHF